MHHNMRSLGTDPRGAVIVEMALVLPLLVMLLLGLVCYGQYFLIAHSVQQIANDAARASIAGLDAAERQSFARAAAYEAADANPEIDRAALGVEVDPGADGKSITVHVSFDAGARLPRFPLVPMPSSRIERSGTVLIGSGA